jgi:hypothetical protein
VTDTKKNYNAPAILMYCLYGMFDVNTSNDNELCICFHKNNKKCICAQWSPTSLLEGLDLWVIGSLEKKILKKRGLYMQNQLLHFILIYSRCGAWAWTYRPIRNYGLFFGKLRNNMLITIVLYRLKKRTKCSKYILLSDY